MEKQLDALTEAKNASYDFVEVCFQKHIISFEQAKKAQNSIHRDYIKDLNKLKKQFMDDRKVESMEVN